MSHSLSPNNGILDSQFMIDHGTLLSFAAIDSQPISVDVYIGENADFISDMNLADIKALSSWLNDVVDAIEKHKDSNFE